MNNELQQWEYSIEFREGRIGLDEYFNSMGSQGWEFAIEKDQEDIRGIVTGTEEYIKSVFKTPHHAKKR